LLAQFLAQMSALILPRVNPTKEKSILWKSIFLLRWHSNRKLWTWILLFSVTIPRAKRQAEVTTLAPEPITTNPGDEATTDAPIDDGGDGEETIDPTGEGEDGETITVIILLNYQRKGPMLSTFTDVNP
jgi:hypothetical protein